MRNDAMKAARAFRSRKSAVRGIALIEALVGILIFAFGIIGLVGLQVAMTRAQGAAKYRADASYLGSEVIGRMWTDQPNLASYNTASCDGYQPCKDWLDRVKSGLPAGAADLAYTAADGTVALTITWSSQAEGTHTHAVTTSIR
jgi:type IV pilus assembly protein PilV